MATDKDDPKGDPKDDPKGDPKDDPKDDPDARAKGLIRAAVDEALEAFAGKHFTPRRTDPEKEGNISVFESLFGKRIT